MAKNWVKIKDFSNMRGIKRAIENAFSEKGAEVARALRELIDELEGAEVEVDEAVLAEKVKAVFEGLKETEKKETEQAVENAVANAVAKRFASVQNSINKELSVKVRNQVAAAILGCRDNNVQKAVENVLVKNEITGYTFEQVVDFAVVENWGDYNPLFAQLHKTYFTKFFYSTQTLADAAILAKQWNKASNVEKAIQTIATNGKEINAKMIYKRQTAAIEDLMEIEKAGESSNFLKFINEELDRMIVNSIVMAILVGDSTNANGNKILSFEGIGTKTTSDAFTSVLNPAGDAVTLADLRNIADAVQNPMGKKKVMIVSTPTLTAVAQFTYATGGSVSFKSKEEVAAMIGVDEIIVSDLIAGDVKAVCMLPDGYWVNEKDALAVAYPQYENNVMNYQKERFIGGAIHDLYSTAVLRAASK